MAHVIVIGAGAIGSHLLPHLARSPRVSRITIIDRDRYDASNTHGQHIDKRDVGRSKVAVQARLLRRISRDLQVVPVRAAVEHVPLGVLRAAAILACLDSRKARMAVNLAAWRLGVPWIDAGVHADGLLARVRVFLPADDAPCLECGWDEADYDAVDQTYPCARAPQPTGAPSMLGALAASLQAIECDKLLAGRTSQALVGRDVLLDARHHRQFVTEYRRNPSCRMPDHAGWRIDPIGADPTQATLEDILALGGTLRGAAGSLALGIAGQRIVTELCCASCAVPTTTCQTERQVRISRLLCPSCGDDLRVSGFGVRDLAPTGTLPTEWRHRPLSEMGVRAHDVLTLRTSEVEAHFEVEAA